MTLRVHGLPRPRFVLLLLVVAAGAWMHFASGAGSGRGACTATVPALAWGLLDPTSREKPLAFTVREAQPVGLSVCDLGGNPVYRVPPSTFPAGSFDLTWDGRVDGSGRHAPAGLYDLRYVFADREVHRLLVLGGIP